MKIELLELHKQLITDVNFSTPFSLENLHLYTLRQVSYLEW